MPRFKPFADRFWDKVDKQPGDGCWLWRGKRSEAGYGMTYCDGRHRSAHRVARELALGVPVPADLDVLHRCDTPACVRPDHTFLGTHADNMRDMVAKGRGWSQRNPGAAAARVAKVRVRPPVGEPHHLAKLTDETVRRIRELRAAGMKYDDIAAATGVGKSTVGRVVNRDRQGGWAHVE